LTTEIFAIEPINWNNKTQDANDTMTFHLVAPKDSSNVAYRNLIINKQHKYGDGSFEFLKVKDYVFDGALFTNVIFEETEFYNCSFRNADFNGCSGIYLCNEGNDLTDAVIHIDDYGDVYNHHSIVNVKENKSCLFGYAETIRQTKSYKIGNLSGTNIILDKGISDARHFRKPFLSANYRYSDIDLSGFLLINTTIQCLSPNSKLDNARIRYADFDRIQLKQLYSTFDYKNNAILGVKFGNSDFENADFKNKNFAGCDFSSRIFDSQNPYTGCNLKNANFTDAIISNCNFGNSNFTLEQLKTTASFKSKELTGVSFQRFDFNNVNLSGFNLAGSIFYSDSNFKDTNFTDAIITNTSWFNIGKKDFDTLTLEQIKSTWNYKNNYMRGIKLPDNIQKELNKEKTPN
ncbi:MAG: pentapeptide repeat-containing protein, partial [Planctomycetaceae bacterium]|jgi:uncharacterized protein YjbI with pentapeptide repeats|nr:pentapeptide repeat-containing protein [Planctomycetaceae bacterium]